MASLHVKNLGPIKDSTQINLTPFMLLMGRQSAGKSTFMKVLCFCRWLEKKIMVSTDDLVSQYTHYGRFKKELMLFHRLDSEYFNNNSLIQYEGDTIRITYDGKDKNSRITRKENFASERFNSKLCYIPAERNLISAIQNIDRAYKATDRDVLFNFIYEWDEAKTPYTKEQPYHLSVTGKFNYVNKSGLDTIKREDGSETEAFYASSGLQSVMPLNVMADYITKRVGEKASLSMSERTSIIEKDPNNSSKRLEYQSAQIFIEEPEQNLYPESQRLIIIDLMRMLADAQKKGTKDSLIMITTHSPYILSVTNVLLRATSLPEEQREEFLEMENTLCRNDFSGYFIDDNGEFINILDEDENEDFIMLRGNELDGVSEWVEEKISQLNNRLYQ